MFDDEFNGGVSWVGSATLHSEDLFSKAESTNSDTV
jgi:hypothetical protein